MTRKLEFKLIADVNADCNDSEATVTVSSIVTIGEHELRKHYTVPVHLRMAGEIAAPVIDHVAVALDAGNASMQHGNRMFWDKTDFAVFEHILKLSKSGLDMAGRKCVFGPETPLDSQLQTAITAVIKAWPLLRQWTRDAFAYAANSLLNEPQEKRE